MLKLFLTQTEGLITSQVLGVGMSSDVVSLFCQYWLAPICSVKLHVLLAKSPLSVCVPQGSCSGPAEAQADSFSADTLFVNEFSCWSLYVVDLQSCRGVSQ